jgi:type I restriction enzyme, S subunit
MSELSIPGVDVWPTAPLGDLCDIVIGRTPSRNRPELWGGDRPWLSIADMNQGRRIRTTKERITAQGVTESGSRLIPIGTVLLSFKLSIGKVAVSEIDTYTNEAIAGLPIQNSERLFRDFLFWSLLSIRLDEEVDEAAKGKTLNKAKLERLLIPLPPLNEQKQIAAVLDKADALRRQRQESLQLTKKLLPSVFTDMFGDPEALPQVDLVQLLTKPLRNGLSPASGGLYPDTVLTLSAITRGSFNSDARKEAGFATQPKPAARVSGTDFLICRGNGNLRLCGQGQFPLDDAIGIVFPDTIIAASIDVERVSKDYFATLWNQPFIRRQIENGARTANGIHKINQTILERIRIPLPRLEVQVEFGRIAQSIVIATKDWELSASHMENLFLALQQRGFRGKLDLSRLKLTEEAETSAVRPEAEPVVIQGRYRRPGSFITPPDIEVQMMALEDKLNNGPEESIQWSDDYFKYRTLSQLLQPPFNFTDIWNAVEHDIEEPSYETVKDKVFEYVEEGTLEQQFDEERTEIVFQPRT